MGKMVLSPESEPWWFALATLQHLVLNRVASWDFDYILPPFSFIENPVWCDIRGMVSRHISFLLLFLLLIEYKSEEITSLLNSLS